MSWRLAAARMQQKQHLQQASSLQHPSSSLCRHQMQQVQCRPSSSSSSRCLCRRLQQQLVLRLQACSELACRTMLCHTSSISSTTPHTPTTLAWLRTCGPQWAPCMVTQG
jgi:hypothetical protein